MEAELRQRPDARRAAAAARALRKRLGVTHPLELPLEIVAQRRGFTVIEAKLRGCVAQLVRLGESGVIMVAEDLAPRVLRYSITHELGHVEVHPHISRLPHCSGDEREIVSTASAPTEREADIFAREWLMPRSYVLPIVEGLEPSWELVRELADDFDVSLTAAAIRLVELSHMPLALVVTRGNVVEWSKPSFRFRHFMRRGQVVDWNSAAWSAKVGVHREASGVWLDAWVPEGPRVGAMEHVLGTRDGALVLLWLPPDR
jgi:Zn-dependent peptidase ImmA (M78 family)